jgi:plastocyanin
LSFLAALLLGCTEAGSGDGFSAEDELKRTLGLDSSAAIHRVSLGGRGSEEHAVPSLVEAAPGDAVIFETVDHRVHTVSFLADSLPSPAATFLRDRSALSSLPLVTRGSTFVVILDGAPSGSYPFVSQGHGGTALGAVVVAMPEDSARGGGG